MKKILLSVAALTMIIGATLLTSCNPEDTTAPVITLTGDNPLERYIGQAYVESGATANDNEDGDLTSSIVTTGTVNVNLKGTYTVTYTVSDAAGNTASKTRTVNVVNSLENMAGSYTVSGTFDGILDPDYTTETVTTSTTFNNRFFVSHLADYQNALVYANVSSSTITIPNQSVICGTDNVSRDFVSTTGTNTITDATHFTITGTVALTSDPGITISWTYTFTKVSK